MTVANQDRLNILLVDDQPAKLLSYEVILSGLGENLVKAGSAREALDKLLRMDVAVILIDVCMPELDGFELATLVREHPRFQKTAIIFVSAIQITDFDRLRGYEAGAVDYVPVPVVPDVLRAKVKVFAELYRKTRDLERLNVELERRVAERTGALEASTARLRESEQRRSLALAAGRMGSWDWDLVTGEYLWDGGQYRIFGVEPASFHPDAASVSALIHPEDRARVEEAERQGVSSGQAYDIEFRILRPGGELRWCVAGAAPTLDREGNAIRLSGVVFDITERKRGEEALRQLNEELEHRIEERTRERETALAQLFEAQKIDTIGQLTGGVAHDFNNLLMAILGSLELLNKRLPPDDGRAKRLLDNAVKGAERGAALTQRLLAFARRQELKPENVDVAGLISGMEDFLKRAVGPAINIRKSLPPDLPPVRADANQLELALLNLAVNARDAMPNGGSVQITAEQELVDPEHDPVPIGIAGNDYVRISVSDDGTGMDEATLAKATEPFFTTKGPGKGTGLGLSMVHGLAAQSGGALRVLSEVGQGTTVELWLPTAEVSAHRNARPGHVAEAPSGRLPDAEARAFTVLIVDDDLLVSTGTAAMLEDLGHVVLEASSGTQALDLLAADPHRVDLVITDHAMPGMTGLELADQVKRKYPSLAVILATGYADLQDQRDQANWPRLSKPFRQDELATAIASAVRGGTAKAPQVVFTLAS